MKILQLTTAYFPSATHGGPVVSIHCLNKALIREGVEVFVITTNSGLSQKEKKRSLIWHDVEGVKVKYFPYYFHENFKFSPQLFFELLSTISDYDLVHINSIWDFNMLAGALSCKMSNIPYIVSPRGSLDDNAFNVSSKFVKVFYYKLCLKQFIKHANAIHFATNDEIKNVTSFVELPDERIVVPNGFDLTELQNLPNKGEFKNKYNLDGKRYILFLGRIHKQKGINFLLEAFKKIRNVIPNLYLVIAGFEQKRYMKEIQKWINENGLPNKIIFTGLITGKEKLAAYIDADVFVLSSYFESFGMTVVEAIGCGVPIIISDRVGIKDDVLKYNAGIVTSLNSSQIAEAILSILNSQTLAAKLSQNGYKLLEEKYDIKKVGIKMLEAYKKICRIN